jgi:putative ABC transport system permease protein
VIRSYLLLAWKVLLRRKFFTFISLFGISFTLVVLLVVTALIDHVVAAYPPETRHDRTVGLFYAQMRSEHWMRNGFAGYAMIDRAAKDLPNVERVGLASMPGTVFSYLNGQRVKSWMKRTDANFWQILDFHFVEGGPFTAADVDGHRMVAVINETTRQRFFGGAPALGRTIEADGQRFTVVGVVPDVSILRIVPFSDIWIPHTTAKSDSYTHEWVGDFMGILLLKDPSRLNETRDEFWSRLRAVQATALPQGFTTLESTPETLFDTIGRMMLGHASGTGSGYGARLQLALLLAALLFMLLPAVNLVNLNASRIMERASEIGVRKSFGASSRALVLQFVVENLFLTLIGAAIGLVLAAAVLSAVNASGIIEYAQLELNVRIFGWGVVLAVAFGLLSGVFPAWRMSRVHPVQALKGTTR